MRVRARSGVFVFLLLFSAGCGVTGRALLPARTPDRPVEDVRAGIDAAGPGIRPGLFTGDAVLRLPDTTLTGATAGRYWGGGVPGAARYLAARYATRALYVCPAGAIQVGRFEAEQRLPGADTPFPVEGRWLARWRDTGAGWRIVEATVRPSPLRTLPLAVDPACVAPSEVAMARHRVSVSAHWGGVWTRGGPAAGMEAGFLYSGLDGPSSHADTWAVGAGARLVGPWGARVLVGRRQAAAAGALGDDAVELSATSTVVGLLALHERWLFRLAAGPAVARVAWEWTGPDATMSSDWSVGWVNELALAIPLRGRLFLDLAYHDWLFRDATPPEGPGFVPIAVRLRGSSVSLGLGGRF